MEQRAHKTQALEALTHLRPLLRARRNHKKYLQNGFFSGLLVRRRASWRPYRPSPLLPPTRHREMHPPVAPFLSIEIDEIAQHHSDKVALAGPLRDRYRLHRRNRERGRWLGCRHRGLGRGIKRGDRTQDFATITKDNAQVFQVVIGQVRQDGEIDTVLGEALRVLASMPRLSSQSGLSAAW